MPVYYITIFYIDVCFCKRTVMQIIHSARREQSVTSSIRRKCCKCYDISKARFPAQSVFRNITRTHKHVHRFKTVRSFLPYAPLKIYLCNTARSSHGGPRKRFYRVGVTCYWAHENTRHNAVQPYYITQKQIRCKQFIAKSYDRVLFDVKMNRLPAEEIAIKT